MGSCEVLERGLLAGGGVQASAQPAHEQPVSQSGQPLRQLPVEMVCAKMLFQDVDIWKGQGAEFALQQLLGHDEAGIELLRPAVLPAEVLHAGLQVWRGERTARGGAAQLHLHRQVIVEML